jgi:hypothetical protein
MQDDTIKQVVSYIVAAIVLLYLVYSGNAEASTIITVLITYILPSPLVKSSCSTSTTSEDGGS